MLLNNAELASAKKDEQDGETKFIDANFLAN